MPANTSALGLGIRAGLRARRQGEHRCQNRDDYQAAEMSGGGCKTSKSQVERQQFTHRILPGFPDLLTPDRKSVDQVGLLELVPLVFDLRFGSVARSFGWRFGPRRTRCGLNPR